MPAFGRMISGFFGSVAIFLGIIMFFIALTGNALVNNIDELEPVVLASAKEFVKENKESMMEYAKEQYDIDDIPSKEEVVLVCDNYDLVSEDARGVVTPELCEGIELKTEDQILDEVIDSFAEGSIESFIGEEASILDGIKGIKEAMLKQKAMFAMLMPLIITSIFVYIIGVLLTFVGANFKLWRGLYRVLFKTSIDVAAFTLLFGYLKYLKPENLIDLMNKFASTMLQDSPLANAPEEFVKLGAKVLLDWVRISIDHLFNLSLYILIPFAVATLALGITLYVLRKKGKVMPGEKVLEKKDKKEVSDKKEEKSVKKNNAPSPNK